MLVGSEFPKKGWVVGDITPFFIGYISKVVWWYSHFCGRFLFRFSWLHVRGLHPLDLIIVGSKPTFLSWAIHRFEWTLALLSLLLVVLFSLVGWFIRRWYRPALLAAGSSVFDGCFLFFVGSTTSWWFYSLLWCLIKSNVHRCPSPGEIHIFLLGSIPLLLLKVDSFFTVFHLLSPPIWVVLLPAHIILFWVVDSSPWQYSIWLDHLFAHIFNSLCLGLHFLFIPILYGFVWK